MVDNIINVIIESRYDTESDWESIDPVLREGELAIIKVKSDKPNSLPEIRIKSGDGVHRYTELPFISAPASDVYNWAKQKNKPIYTADEIIGLGEFKHTHTVDDIIGLQGGNSSSNNTSNTGNTGKKIIADIDGGLKITETEDSIVIGINTEMTFMLDGGTSSQFL